MNGSYYPGFNYEEEMAKSKLWQNQMAQNPQLTMPSVGSETAPSYAPQVDLGGKNYASKIQAQGNNGMSNAEMASLGSSAAGGAIAGGPAGAAIAVGGQLAAQYLANKAQAEQAKRQRDMEIAQHHSAGERQGIDQMLSAWKGSLR